MNDPWHMPSYRQQALAEVARIVQLPDVAQRFQLDGTEAVGSTPTEFSAFLNAEMQKWSKVFRDAASKRNSEVHSLRSRAAGRASAVSHASFSPR
jgi:hypothetical protein